MGVRTYICVGLVAVYFYTGTLGLLVGMIVWFGVSYALTRLRSARADAVEVDIVAEPLLGHSAVELAAMVRRGEVTSVQLVETFIKQIEKVNPKLNAMVATRFDEAREEARRADEITQQTADKAALPPLHGVPCSVKEAMELTGMPQCSGLLSRRHRKSTKDATVVQRLRKAGAIPLGVTNVSEVCMWMESANKVYGRSNNAYNTNHTVGGSSGGEGCIVSAAGAAFGVGSDIGGSIRMPCYFNGIFGHKPSAGLVPNTGQYPIAVNQALRYMCTGPMCKRADDLWPLLKIMAGPDGVDTYQQHLELGDPSHVDIKSLRILWGDPCYMLTFSASEEIQRAQRACVEHLGSLGAKDVQKIDMAEFKEGMDVWSSLMAAAGGPTFSELLGNGKPIRSSLELLKWIVDVGSEYTLPAIGLALLEALPRLMPERAKRSVENGDVLKARLEELLGDDGVLILPTYPTTAPAHGMAILPPTNWVNTAMWNVMEVPVTAVPLGLDSKGLPMGVQVIGKHGNDHVTIAVAMMLERRFGGWVPPRPRHS